ncbi:MAG: mitochondrial import receptor protein [Stictis urceolatum]|nr:mitochondrial import receptor protein [Stictis urceolata]
MVRLEEVEDEEFVQQGEKDLFEDDDDFTDTDSELSDDDDALLAVSESITDRISALKDIIPPATRRRVHNAFETVSSYGKTGLWFSGKAAWVISTSALLWSIPFALALVEEQQIQEMEKEQKMREMGNELLTPGAQSVVPGQPGQQGAKPAL